MTTAAEHAATAGQMARPQAPAILRGMASLVRRGRIVLRSRDIARDDVAIVAAHPADAVAPRLYVTDADGRSEVRLQLPSGADLLIARG